MYNIRNVLKGILHYVIYHVIIALRVCRLKKNKKWHRHLCIFSVFFSGFHILQVAYKIRLIQNIIVT